MTFVRKSQYQWGFAVLFLLLLGCPGPVRAENTARLMSDEVFGLLGTVLSSSPDISQETLESMLKTNRFTGKDDNWYLVDARGRLALNAFVKTKSFIIKYVPVKPNRISDGVLAALISKSSGLNMSDASELEINIMQRSLSQGRYHGNMYQWFIVSLTRGEWVRSAIVIEWKETQ